MAACLCLGSLGALAQAADFSQVKLAFDLQRYEPARQGFLELAEAGDARAMFYLGVIYNQGLGVAADLPQAFAWYEKAAKLGHAVAQYNLGNAFKHGRGTAKSEVLAVFWWEKAAEQGQANAQYNLALQYYLGLGTDKNSEKALHYFHEAADRGHPKAKALIAEGKVPARKVPAAQATTAPATSPPPNPTTSAPVPEAVARSTTAVPDKTPPASAAPPQQQALTQPQPTGRTAPTSEPKDSLPVVPTAIGGAGRANPFAGFQPVGAAAHASPQPVAVFEPAPAARGIEARQGGKPGGEQVLPVGEIPAPAKNAEPLAVVAPPAPQGQAAARLPPVQPMPELAPPPAPPSPIPQQRQQKTDSNKPASSSSPSRPPAPALPPQAGPPTVTVLDREWLLAQKPSDCAIQLAVMSTQANLNAFLSSYDLVGKVRVVEIVAGQHRRYHVLLGNYPSIDAANARILELNPSLQALKPWARSYAALSAIGAP